MKLDFNNYPLSVYNKATAKSLLKSVECDVPYSQYSQSSISETILSSFVKKAAGAGLLTLIDDVSIEHKGEKARKCLSNLIREQAIRVNNNPSRLIEEVQLNLMASSCITGYLASLESGSWGNGVKNFGKSIIGLFSLKNPLDVIWESVTEVSNKYDDICQVYHIAFLLIIYDLNPRTEEYIVKRLITESLCNDNEGVSSFSTKKRPILFSGIQYKSLEDNLKNRLNILEAKNYDDLYDPFVKWRKEINAQ